MFCLWTLARNLQVADYKLIDMIGLEVSGHILGGLGLLELVYLGRMIDSLLDFVCI